MLSSERSDYWSERVDCWWKVKFPMVGFIKDPADVAALYLGKKEGKDLVYMGKVGIAKP